MNYAQSRRSHLHAMMEGGAQPMPQQPPAYRPPATAYAPPAAPYAPPPIPPYLPQGHAPTGYAPQGHAPTGYEARAFGSVPVGPEGTMVPVNPRLQTPPGYIASRAGVTKDGHLTYHEGAGPRFRRPGEGTTPSHYYNPHGGDQTYAPTQMDQVNWSAKRGPIRQTVDPSAMYKPQERLTTTKPFVLFIKTPTVIEIDVPDGMGGFRKEKIPDGSANIGHIYNKLPRELRQHIQYHNLDLHPYKPPGLQGVPQLYDATRGEHGSYIPFGTQTVVKFLVMVRLMGIDVRMAELHPSGVKLDHMANQLLQRQTEEKKKQGRAGPAAYKDEALSNWQRKIMQNEKNPYDPSLKADTGEGGLLFDAAPAMSDHLAEIAYVDIFDTGGTNEDDATLKLGVPLDRFDDVGYIDEDALNAVRKLSDKDMESRAGQREEHMLKLMHKIRPPQGGSSSQLKGYGPRELMTT